MAEHEQTRMIPTGNSRSQAKGQCRREQNRKTCL